MFCTIPRRTAAAASILAIAGAVLLTDGAPASAATPDHYNNVITWSLTQTVRHGPAAWNESEQFSYSGTLVANPADGFHQSAADRTHCVGSWGGAFAYHYVTITKSAPADKGVSVDLENLLGTGTFQCMNVFDAAYTIDATSRDTVTVAGNTSRTLTTSAENLEDGNKVTTTWTLTNTVMPDNTIPPVSSVDRYTTPYGTAVSVDAAHGVLANDADPNGNPLTAQLVSGPSGGTLYWHADGSFTYSPHAGFSGADSFTYRAHNGTVAGPVTTVYVSTQDKHVGPTPSPDTYRVRRGATLTTAAPGVLANDASPAGLALQAYLVTNPSHGTVTMAENGSFTYKPAAGFAGTDSFLYQDYDGSGIDGFSAPTSVTVEVGAKVVAKSGAATITRARVR